MGTRTLASIKRRHYRVMYRAAAAYTRPATTGDFTTFLATLTEMGYARGGSIKYTEEPADVENLDTGQEKNMGFNGHLEAEIIQTEPADYTELEGIEGAEEDLFLYSEVSGQCIFLPEWIPYFKTQVTGGETEVIVLTANKTNQSAKTALKDLFAEPT